MERPGEVVEFSFPVEDPDCVLCKVSPATRTMAILAGAEFGESKVIDRNGREYRLNHVEHGSGGITELLAAARRRAREADRKRPPAEG